MKKILLVTAAALTLGASQAMAGFSFGLSIGLPAPAVVVSAPAPQVVVAAPAQPVYYAPAPAPVYYAAPAPVYVTPQVVYGPRVVVGAPYYRGYYGHYHYGPAYRVYR